MMSKIKKLLLFLPAFFCADIIAEHQVFEPHTLSEIESHYLGKSFLMIVWSIDCAPCRGELQLVSEIKEQHPNLNLAFVATDGVEQSVELDGILSSYNIKQPAWVFSKPSSQRLRYAIDRNWYGEMPRSYFYDTAHKRVGVSGQLTKEKIIRWIELSRRQLELPKEIH